MEKMNDEDMVWVRVRRRTRKRLNLTKAVWGIADDGILDQDATINTALDRATLLLAQHQASQQ